MLWNKNLNRQKKSKNLTEMKNALVVAVKSIKNVVGRIKC